MTEDISKFLYFNGQSYTFTWENGRQLASAIPSDTFVHFEYNADGIRTEKRVSKTYNMYYRLDGDKVVEMVKSGVGVNNRYVFIYDNDGTMILHLHICGMIIVLLLHTGISFLALTITISR